jgi:hypothetical protein
MFQVIVMAKPVKHRSKSAHINAHQNEDRGFLDETLFNRLTHLRAFHWVIYNNQTVGLKSAWAR